MKEETFLFIASDYSLILKEKKEKWKSLHASYCYTNNHNKKNKKNANRQTRSHHAYV